MKPSRYRPFPVFSDADTENGYLNFILIPTISVERLMFTATMWRWRVWLVWGHWRWGLMAQMNSPE